MTIAKLNSDVSGVQGLGIVIASEPLDNEEEFVENPVMVHQVAVLQVTQGDINLHRRDLDGTFWFLESEME